MPHPKVKISDDSGNTVDVTSNALHVKLADSDDIDIGNVVLTNTTGTDIYSPTATSDSTPNLDANTLLGTHALLSARENSSTTRGLACNSDGALSVELADVIGLTANSGPAKAVSVAGTQSLGTLRELLVDAQGHLQIDVLTAPSTAVTNAGTFAVQSTLQAGSATFGKLAANSGVDIGDVDVTSIVSSGTTIASYPQFDVDTSALQLNHATAIDASVTTAKEIIIQCGFTNTGYIVVGDSALVAAEGVDSMDGIRLEAGDTLTLAATTTENIWLRGSANDQLVNVMIIS